MSSKQETNQQPNTSTDTNSSNEFTPELKFIPPELQNVNVDYKYFGSFNKLPALTPSSDQPK